MMNAALLAKTMAEPGAFQPLRQFPGQTEVLHWCDDLGLGTGILLILVGMVYLIYGWSMYKPLFALNSALLGGYIGAAIGHHYGATVVGGTIGCIAALASTLPLMKWAVAVVGGICGGVLGAAVWRTSGLDPGFAWAGGMTGLVAFGMFSFILFRGGIILYTSLEGALLVIAGVLTLAFKYQEVGSKLAGMLNAQPYALPAAILIPAALGMIYQHTHTASADGGGGGGNQK